MLHAKIERTNDAKLMVRISRLDLLLVSSKWARWLALCVKIVKFPTLDLAAQHAVLALVRARVLTALL
jgi:hypothetical protein